MMGTIKKLVYWSFLILLFIVGTSLNLVLDKNVSLGYALKQMVMGPLPVRAYFVLLGILTFVCGELILNSLQAKSKIAALWSFLILMIGWGLTHYYYFLLLALFGLAASILLFILARRKQDAIHAVLETVMSGDLETEEPEEETEVLLAENEEPEVTTEPEVSLDDIQQKEIDLFLDSLFEKSGMMPAEEEPLEEPFAREILSDANELLEISEEQEIADVIEKEPPKEVVLQKKTMPAAEDLLEEEFTKQEDPLGEFDEEIPLDDLVK